MKILVADQLAQSALDSLLNQGDVRVDPSLKEQTLSDALQEFQPEVLVVRSTKVTDEHIRNTPSLSLIIRAGAGVNTIALDAASEQGVFVANCPGKNAIAVAELVMGQIINMDRKLYDNIKDFREGIWNKKKYSKATGLYGKTIAILGLGAIGKEVAIRAKSFGLNIKAWSRSLRESEAKALGITYCSSPIEAVSNADILTVHLPSSAETKEIINSDLLGHLRDNAYVINTSRGSLLRESDMEEASRKKGIHFALDVFQNEPAANDHHVETTWMNSENIYVTHHIGASTEQATDAVGWAVVEIIETWQKEGLVINCVNLAKQTAATSCLSVRHADKVGVLANVLEHVRADGLNIQEMDNIIFQGGKAACARIFLVGNPSQTLIHNLQANPDIFACSIS